MANNNETSAVKDNSNIKSYMTIFILLVASFISVFGIYNNYNYHLIGFISEIEDKHEAIANYTLLGIFSFTMIFLQSIHWKRKDMLSKFSIMVVLAVAIVSMLAIIYFYVDNFLFPLLSIVILGMTFYLIELVFITLGISGIFFATVIYSIISIGFIKVGIATDFKTVFSNTQIFLALLLFLGAAYPRIKSALFQIRTRDNIELDNNGDGFSDNDSGDNEN